jgi:hypothetical protein
VPELKLLHQCAESVHACSLARNKQKRVALIWTQVGGSFSQVEEELQGTIFSQIKGRVASSIIDPFFLLWIVAYDQVGQLRSKMSNYEVYTLELG